MKIKLLAIFVATCWLSYDLTDNSYVPATAVREPSSEIKPETKNSYARLRCPTESEFQQWSLELHIDPIEGASLDMGCKGQNSRSQLAQVLALSREIKMNFPKNWAPSVQAEIKNSYEYIKNNTNKLVIDLSQTNSIARNVFAEKRIELGGMFFKEEPLEALSVLIHEARHSDTRDPKHATCRIGDIPLTAGGCDNIFSSKAEDAGAYAYGTLYGLALAQFSPNLDAAEREQMISTAFTTLGTRFNTFKSTIAKHFDIVTVLLEDGTLAWIHPFSGNLVPLNIELPKFQESIKKIEFSPRTNSLLLFTQSDRLFVWGPNSKIVRLGTEATSEDDRYLHVSRQYVPYVNDYTYYTTLKTNGELEYLRYSPELNKLKVEKYPLHENATEPDLKVPNLAYFVLGNGMRSYFIDRQGILSRACNYGNEPNFIIDKDIQSETGGYKIATGGAFYDSLILTDSDGKLNQVKLFYPENSDDEAEKKESFEFQSPNRAKKYLQGLSFHAVLDEDGSLLLENYRNGKSRLSYRFDKRITDFVITRLTTSESSIFKNKNLNQALLTKCGVQKIIENIGYGSVLGLNSNGKLVAVTSNGNCSLILPNKAWTNAELQGIDSADIGVQPFPDLQLRLSSQNERLIWPPYTRSSLDQSK